MINSRSNKDHTDKSTKKEALGTLFFKESFDQTGNQKKKKEKEILIKADKFLRKKTFCSKPEEISTEQTKI